MTAVTMEISVNPLAFKVLNGPLCILSLVNYIFYAFCLFCNQDGADVRKQPLKVLLVTLVAFMAALQISNLLNVFLITSTVLWQFFHAVELIQFYFFLSTLVTMLWLNVFYYTKHPSTTPITVYHLTVLFPLG